MVRTKLLLWFNLGSAAASAAFSAFCTFKQPYGGLHIAVMDVATGGSVHPLRGVTDCVTLWQVYFYCFQPVVVCCLGVTANLCLATACTSAQQGADA